MSLLYKHAMEYEIKGQDIYEKLLNDINLLSKDNNNKSIIYEEKIVNDYIENLNESQSIIIKEIKKNIIDNEILWGIDRNIIYILKKNTIIGKLVAMTSTNKIKVLFPIDKKSITLNIDYEIIDGNYIIIEIINKIDNDIINIIKNRLNIN